MTQQIRRDVNMLLAGTSSLPTAVRDEVWRVIDQEATRRAGQAGTPEAALAAADAYLDELRSQPQALQRIIDDAQRSTGSTGGSGSVGPQNVQGFGDDTFTPRDGFGPHGEVVSPDLLDLPGNTVNNGDPFGGFFNPQNSEILNFFRNRFAGDPTQGIEYPSWAPISQDQFRQEFGSYMQPDWSPEQRQAFVTETVHRYRNREDYPYLTPEKLAELISKSDGVSGQEISRRVSNHITHVNRGWSPEVSERYNFDLAAMNLNDTTMENLTDAQRHQFLDLMERAKLTFSPEAFDDNKVMISHIMSRGARVGHEDPIDLVERVIELSESMPPADGDVSGQTGEMLRFAEMFMGAWRDQDILNGLLDPRNRRFSRINSIDDITDEWNRADANEFHGRVLPTPEQLEGMNDRMDFFDANRGQVPGSQMQLTDDFKNFMRQVLREDPQSLPPGAGGGGTQQLPGSQPGLPPADDPDAD